MTTTAAQPQHFQAVQQPQPFSSSSPCGPSVSATSQMSPQMASVSIGQSPSHHPSSYVGHAQHPFYAHPYQQQQLTTVSPIYSPLGTCLPWPIFIKRIFFWILKDTKPETWVRIPRSPSILYGCTKPWLPRNGVATPGKKFFYQKYHIFNK